MGCGTSANQEPALSVPPGLVKTYNTVDSTRTVSTTSSHRPGKQEAQQVRNSALLPAAQREPIDQSDPLHQISQHVDGHDVQKEAEEFIEDEEAEEFASDADESKETNVDGKGSVAEENNSETEDLDEIKNEDVTELERSSADNDDDDEHDEDDNDDDDEDDDHNDDDNDDDNDDVDDDNDDNDDDDDGDDDDDDDEADEEEEEEDEDDEGEAMNREYANELQKAVQLFEDWNLDVPEEFTNSISNQNIRKNKKGKSKRPHKNRRDDDEEWDCQLEDKEKKRETKGSMQGALKQSSAVNAKARKKTMNTSTDEAKQTGKSPKTGHEKIDFKTKGMNNEAAESMQEAMKALGANGLAMPQEILDMHAAATENRFIQISRDVDSESLFATDDELDEKLANDKDAKKMDIERSIQKAPKQSRAVHAKEQKKSMTISKDKAKQTGKSLKSRRENFDLKMKAMNKKAAETVQEAMAAFGDVCSEIPKEILLDLNAAVTENRSIPFSEDDAFEGFIPADDELEKLANDEDAMNEYLRNTMQKAQEQMEDFNVDIPKDFSEDLKTYTRGTKPKQKVTSHETRPWLTGSFNVSYPSTVKVVRIFTSSTFTDTQVERNNLMQRVYPKLKEYCQSVGYEFQVVDMRWGVRDESTDDHLTSQLCMKELEECQKLSTGPNFITFLGQKYGYRPFPPSTPAERFDLLISNVPKAEDVKLLKDWFRKDDNAVPPTYWLTPKKKKVPTATLR